MVKRVFITSDLRDQALPQWASWVKVVIDGMQLPFFFMRIVVLNEISSS